MIIDANGLKYDLTADDVAKHFDYTSDHVRHLARTGKLPYMKRGGQYRFNLAQVTRAILRTDIDIMDRPCVLEPDHVIDESVESETSDVDTAEEIVWGV